LIRSSGADSGRFLGLRLFRGNGHSYEYRRMLLSPTHRPPPEQLQVLLEAALQAWEADKEEEARLPAATSCASCGTEGISLARWGGALRGERRHGAEASAD